MVKEYSSSKITTRGSPNTAYLANLLYAISKKILLSSKMAAILNFQLLRKMQKHKFASISLTVHDRAILWKFQTTECLSKLLNAISKKFYSSKMVAFFAKNAKTQICFYLRNRTR